VTIGACFWEPIPLDGIYLPQILHGFGSGMVDVPLLVAAHAACYKRADVAITTGFLVTVKEMAVLFGLASCDAILGYYEPVEALDALSPSEYSKDGKYSTRAVWGFLTVANAVIMAVTFSTAVVGMNNVRLPQYPSDKKRTNHYFLGGFSSINAAACDWHSVWDCRHTTA